MHDKTLNNITKHENTLCFYKKYRNKCYGSKTLNLACDKGLKTRLLKSIETKIKTIKTITF